MNGNKRNDDRAGSPLTDDRAARLERQLGVTQQLTHIGSWEWSVATNEVTWSDELYRIYGLEPRSCEITLEGFLERLHPDDRARVQRAVGEAIERGGRFAYPERIVRPDGSVRQLDTVGEAIQDAQGRVVRLVGTCRDVTRERAQDATIRVYADIVNHVQIGLACWRVDDLNGLGIPHLIALNPAAERAARMPSAEASDDEEEDHAVRGAFPSIAGTELEELLLQVARDGATRDVHGYRFADPAMRARVFTLKVFPLPDSCVGLALEDTTAQARARQLQAAEQRVLEMAASGAALGDVLTALVLAIEEQAPETIASILLLDADGARVKHGAAPHLPDEYNRAIDGVPIGPMAGSCGTSMFFRKAVFVSDIETDPLWASYRHLARPHGLRACWSTPIFANDGSVLGSFALYYRTPQSPTDDMLQLIARATHVAGIAIQRRELDDQLRALSAHIEAVREDERTGIAREIHDELGQALTAMKMDVAWIARRAAGPVGLPTEVLLEKAKAITDMIDESVQQVRRISSELRPGVLDDLGLSAALEWQSQEFEKRTGIGCALDSCLGDTRFERNLSTAVFRIFQEALTNVARHAEAKYVDVRVEHANGALHLEVRDDGKGIPPDALKRPRSLGLLGMRERAARLGGTVTVQGTDGVGTVVTLDLPVPSFPSGAPGGAS